MTGIDQERIDRLENYVLACGIRGSKWTSDEDWDMIPGLFADDQASDTALITLKK